MQLLGQTSVDERRSCTEQPLFAIVCASGFENEERVRSALMFASLAASADFQTILYCIQGAVEVMVKGAIAARETPRPGLPSTAQRLQEALEMGVEIQCCTQTMANKKISPQELVEGVSPAGAMSLIAVTTRARGTISF
ncbi:MAG TPA: DsrE family protein [bacterium]